MEKEGGFSISFDEEAMAAAEKDDATDPESSETDWKENLRQESLIEVIWKSLWNKVKLTWSVTG